MTNAYGCDLCGEYADGYPEIKISMKLGKEYIGGVAPRHLCETCAENFAEWVETIRGQSVEYGQ